MFFFMGFPKGRWTSPLWSLVEACFDQRNNMPRRTNLSLAIKQNTPTLTLVSIRT
jgi:hypothetical protein